MKPNPDEIYWAKAATDPVAPATLWLYPDLERVERSARKSALDSAKRKAMRHWVSKVLGWIVIIIAAVQLWALVADRSGLRSAITYTFSMVMLAWLMHQFMRTRMELRNSVAKVSPGESGSFAGSAAKKS